MADIVHRGTASLNTGTSEAENLEVSMRRVSYTGFIGPFPHYHRINFLPIYVIMHIFCSLLIFLSLGLSIHPSVRTKIKLGF